MTTASPTSFELRVEMSGLCMFAVDAKRPKVAVLMPDARLKDSKTSLKTLDGEKAKPHVGYLRFDLANLDSSAVGALPADDRDKTPNFEVVHLLDREEVQFGLDGESGSLTNNIVVPDFDQFAPELELDPAHLEKLPPEVVLARTFLRGGRIESAMIQNQIWHMEQLGNPNKSVGKEYGSQTWWTRTVHGQSLTLRVAKFDRSQVVNIPLKPTVAKDGAWAITLKMSNLCAMNPLEWSSLEGHFINTDDVDFKWLYSLLRKKKDAVIDYPPAHLPHPKPEASGEEGMLQDCFSGRISANL